MNKRQRCETAEEQELELKFEEDSRYRLPEQSSYKGECLQFELRAVDGRARRGTLTLPHSVVETPCFMPVGTNGPMKMILAERMEKLGPQLMLNNTYHLGARIGKDRLARFGGSHKMMQWDKSLLTDSGGFQMVSLLKLAKITEEGVEFENPHDGKMMMLTPEESISIQKTIGSDVMMALDDVISAVSVDRSRFEESVHRTTRWLRRCMNEAAKPNEFGHRQNLWGIVQGGLDRELRAESLRQIKGLGLPGYAIGGLSGGEAKSDFWNMVEICTRRNDEGLPENQSRYLMGVGYPLDIVICVALGCDLFDCVFPTRTARFGVALTDEGHLRLRAKEFKNDERPVDPDCDCYLCMNCTRAFVNASFTATPSVLALLSEHNIRYLHNLGCRMRQAIVEHKYPEFVRKFLARQFDPEKKACPPRWIKDALEIGAGIPEVSSWYNWPEKPEEEQEKQSSHATELDPSDVGTQSSSGPTEAKPKADAEAEHAGSKTPIA